VVALAEKPQPRGPRMLPGRGSGPGWARRVMLSIRNLDVYYGDAQALMAVSLDVPAGELVALVGANGAGKSSLIRSIAGMETPRAGTIKFRDTEITGKDSHFTSNLGIGQ